jgi:hypothetical protein
MHSTKGIVVGHDSNSRSAKGYKSLATIVEFSVADNKIEFVDPACYPWKRYRQGKEVTVLYLPSAPEDSPRIKSFWGIWSGCVFCFLLSFLFIWSFIASCLGWKNPISPE